MNLRNLPLPLLEAGLIVAWSSGFIGARFSIDQAPAMLVVFWRCLLVALVLLPWAWRPLRQASPQAWLHTAGSGLLAMGGYLAGVVQGIALGVPAGLAALVADLLPLGVALLSATALAQRLGWRAWGGLLVGLAGVLIVTANALSLGNAPGYAYALPLLGMLSLAVATLWQKHSAAASAMPLVATLWLHCAGSCVVFAVLASLEGSLAPIRSAGFAASVLWTALPASLGGYGLYWLCLRRSSPTRVASVLYLSPAVTLLWAWAMFGEPLSWLIALGAGLCLLGVLVVVRAEQPRGAPRPRRSTTAPARSCPARSDRTPAR
ncbi:MULTISPECIES: DMT family transporter [unclassified Pseudomonas]|uniref:DMT family transporter n=1 Tax=unclassified Pseudomonas TaxID=196821 RepID=UPI000BD5D30A|nr:MULTISPECIES: DMT family transporter [unclassified Pseudomonas]PVZ20512.1 drug/metabolite transporter (DMT)-like permease [Pseudomonas sp. URIL14HWK12:I12]PVZ27578.1 drug/metabolite transporter (DMT)-like permease [Pseudomonas sp. URIL14HWK12:I10]PVZ38467.1 drug/metabolite transporter (DMT)-like permease [Pseudomonas sp. URIL14HWK12:I11]SNZ03241.1 Permease of the drug/metabolite transporter (DMT) superfamily [Pseudomonas sp. URIL14HWK12:I9]